MILVKLLPSVTAQTDRYLKHYNKSLIKMTSSSQHDVKLKDEGFILKHVRNFFLEDLVETFGQMLTGFWIISLNFCGLIFCWREISETLMEDSGE